MAYRIPQRFTVTNSDRFNYTLGRTYNRQISVVVALDGRVDEERMARAVRLTMDAEPVLGCRLAEDPRLCWLRRDDLETRTFSTVVPTDNVERSLQHAMGETWDPFQRPLIDLKILRGTTDTILLKLEHTVTDGGGTKDVLYLLADIYQRLEGDPGFRPIPNIRGDRSFRQVFLGLDIKGKRRMLRPFQRTEAAAVFPYRNPDRDKRAAALRRIGPDDFRRMKAYGREHGATVNDMLLAAFFRAFFQLNPGDPGTPFIINVPVDLRPMTKKRRAGAVANLTGGYLPTVVPAECGDFRQTLLAMQSAMTVWKKNGIQIGRSVLSDFSGRRQDLEYYRRLLEPGHDHSEKTGRIVPVLTNLGIIDREKLTFGELTAVDAYFLGPVIFPPFFTVCVSTFADTMTLMTGYCREPEGDQPVEEFMDRWAEALEDR